MSGTNLALPFLMINLGGEMIYILNQRLIAQKIPADKSEKVRADVVKHMFSEAFIRELLAPQPLYSMTSTRQVFDKIAQSSIMKLQTASMNKLFDLMLMGLKTQLLTLEYPEQLLRITLNHIQELTRLVSSKDPIALLASTSEMMIKTYSSCSAAVFNRIRQALLRFFQNRNVKVTMFLHSGVQLPDGTIKITVNTGMPMSDVPGKLVRNGVESIKTLPLTAGFRRNPLSTRHPLQAQTLLGTNLYSSERYVGTAPLEEVKEEQAPEVPDRTRGDIAVWELNSLANMIYSPAEEEEGFSVNLFTGVDLEFKDTATVEVTGLVKNTHLEKIQKELEETKENAGRKGRETKEKEEEDDLMDLL